MVSGGSYSQYYAATILAISFSNENTIMALKIILWKYCVYQSAIFRSERHFQHFPLYSYYIDFLRLQISKE